MINKNKNFIQPLYNEIYEFAKRPLFIDKRTLQINAIVMYFVFSYHIFIQD